MYVARATYGERVCLEGETRVSRLRSGNRLFLFFFSLVGHDRNTYVQPRTFFEYTFLSGNVINLWSWHEHTNGPYISGQWYVPGTRHLWYLWL